MEFVASMTHRANDLISILDLWKKYGDDRNPFRRTIYTPLFARQDVNAFMEKNFKSAGGVIFDSGGYFVQQGATTYESLYQKLLGFYKENQWADWYVLPDYVPTSSNDSDEVQKRVNATVTVSSLFYSELPNALKKKALPVVQGHTLEQIRHCVENFASLGTSYVGFGSFGTSGKNNSINTITKQSIRMIEFLKKQTEKFNLKLHLFGIGTPSVLPLFYDLGIDSFDSSSWSRTAGYGNVFLPFRGRRNISHGMAREIGGRAYETSEFSALKEETGHNCPFCEDIENLQKNRIYQMMHNLVVVLDTVDALNSGETIHPNVIGLSARKYRSLKKGNIYQRLDLGGNPDDN